MNESVTFKKSKSFASRIVKLYKFLKNEKQEYIMSEQLIRSGTSIGANIAEAEFAISKRDFNAKMYIALKECAETKYWLDLLFDTDYLTTVQYDSLNGDCVELLRLLTSITKKSKKQIEQQAENVEDAETVI